MRRSSERRYAMNNNFERSFTEEMTEVIKSPPSEPDYIVAKRCTPFFITLPYTGVCNINIDKCVLKLKTGLHHPLVQKIRISKTFIEPYGNEKYPEYWQATAVINQFKNAVFVCLMSPSFAIVGPYKVTLKVSDEVKMSSKFHLLLNPFCPVDEVYLASKMLTYEYIVSTDFKIYSPERTELALDSLIIDQYDVEFLEQATYFLNCMDPKEKKCPKTIAQYFAQNLIYIFDEHLPPKKPQNPKHLIRGNRNTIFTQKSTDTHIAEHLLSLVYLILTLRAIGIPARLVFSGLILAGIRDQNLKNYQMNLENHLFNSAVSGHEASRIEILHRNDCNKKKKLRWVQIKYKKKEDLKCCLNSKSRCSLAIMQAMKDHGIITNYQPDLPKEESLTESTYRPETTDVIVAQTLIKQKPKSTITLSDDLIFSESSVEELIEKNPRSTSLNRRRRKKILRKNTEPCIKRPIISISSSSSEYFGTLSDRPPKEDTNREDRSMPDRTREDRSKEDRSLQDRSREDRNRWDKSREDRSMQDRSMQDRSMHDRSMQDRSMQDKSMQDRSMQDKSMQDRSMQDKSMQNRSIQDRSREGRSREDISDSSIIKITEEFERKMSATCEKYQTMHNKIDEYLNRPRIILDDSACEPPLQKEEVSMIRQPYFHSNAKSSGSRSEESSSSNEWAPSIQIKAPLRVYESDDLQGEIFVEKMIDKCQKHITIEITQVGDTNVPQRNLYHHQTLVHGTGLPFYNLEYSLKFHVPSEVLYFEESTVWSKMNIKLLLHDKNFVNFSSVTHEIMIDQRSFRSTDQSVFIEEGTDRSLRHNKDEELYVTKISRYIIYNPRSRIDQNSEGKTCYITKI